MAKRLITGLTLRGQTAEWATLDADRQGGGRPHTGKAELELAGAPQPLLDALEPETRSAVAAELKSKCAALKGAVSLGVPSAQLFLRVLSLPMVGRDELRSMVELQVDKYSPFPADSLVVGHEILAERNGQYRVLATAIKREQVDAIETLFRGTNCTLHRLDLEIMGWWRLLTDAGALAGSGCELVLVLDVHGADLVVAVHGMPVAIRSLGGQAGASDEEYAAEIATELSNTLTAVEAELEGADGEAALVPSVTVWHWDATPAALLSEIRETCLLQAHAQSLDALPPLAQGLARRACQREPLPLNLAPGEWRRRRGMRRMRRHFVAATVLALLLWAASAGTLFFGVSLERRRLQEALAHVQRVRDPAGGVRELRVRAEKLALYGDRTHSALECLREICDGRLPDGVELTHFDYDRTKRAKQVILRGTAVSAPHHNRFVKALTDSGLFVDVRGGGLTRDRRKNVEVFNGMTLSFSGGTQE